MKIHGLFFSYSLPNFLFSSITAFSFPCLWGLVHDYPRLQTPNCNSLLILNQPIFDGEISGSLFVLGQFWWPVQGPEKTPDGSGAGEQTGAVPTNEPIVTHCFSLQPWNLKIHLSPGSKLMPSLHLKLSRVYSESILRFHLSG